MFHDIDRETAERSFAHIYSKYNVIGLNQFIEACETKNASGLPRKAVVITFDDGHKGNYELLSVVRKYEAPITIFLCSSIIDTNRHYWFKVKHNRYSTQELKLKSNKEKLALMAEVGFDPEKEYDTPQALSKKQIEELRPHVNFQSHTMFHPCLPQCELDEEREEIETSKRMLEQEYGLDINAIAYPNGDFSERTVELTKAAGYKCGLTVDFGFNIINSDLFRLKRIDLNDTSDMNEMIVRASGLWDILKHPSQIRAFLKAN